MNEPNYDLILKSKIEYYGETKAAYEFAANEFAEQKVLYNNKFNINNSLPTQEDIKKAISAIRQTYNDLVDGDIFPIDEFSTVALNLKYALRKLGNEC